MKQILMILIFASFFIGCATTSNKTSKYDYLFEGELEPVNNKKEQQKALKSLNVRNVK